MKNKKMTSEEGIVWFGCLTILIGVLWGLLGYFNAEDTAESVISGTLIVVFGIGMIYLGKKIEF